MLTLLPLSVPSAGEDQRVQPSNFSYSSVVSLDHALASVNSQFFADCKDTPFSFVFMYLAAVLQDQSHNLLLMRRILPTRAIA